MGIYSGSFLVLNDRSVEYNSEILIESSNTVNVNMFTTGFQNMYAVGLNLGDILYSEGNIDPAVVSTENIELEHDAYIVTDITKPASITVEVEDYPG